MSASNRLTITDFKCMICQNVIAFDINNPSSYNNSTVLEEFFSMRLTRFDVSHEVGEDEHVNIVIVDQDGKYRGHKDVYVNKKKNNQVIINYNLLTDRLIAHNNLDLFFVLNMSKNTIKEYINKIYIKTINLVEKLVPFINQNLEIYEVLPSDLLFSYANKSFHIIMLEEGTFCCFTFKNDFNTFNNLFFNVINNLKGVINGSAENSPLIKLIYTVLNISNSPTFNDEDLIYIKRLLNSDVFFSELQINPGYKDRIQLLKSSFQEEFPCSELILNRILISKTSLVEIFDSNSDQYKCIIDFIDYLKRRRLFIF